jgi:hypothetical protein
LPVVLLPDPLLLLLLEFPQAATPTAAMAARARTFIAFRLIG